MHSVITKSVSRPRKLYLASANAAIELIVSVSTVAATVTMVLLRKYWPKLKELSASV